MIIGPMVARNPGQWCARLGMGCAISQLARMSRAEGYQMESTKVIRIPARLSTLWTTEHARYDKAGRIARVDFVNLGTTRATMIITLKG